MVDIRDALFSELYELGKKDADVVILTADADAFALRKFKQEFPDRFFNMGVSEQNTILFATGLAMGGKKVFIYSIIPFITMRCLEQIKANVCSMNLPVTIIGLGAGLSFSFDGPTHHAIHDIGIMRMLPEMSIYNPSNAATARTAITHAYQNGTPNYIRLDKGIFPDNDTIERKSLVDGVRMLRGASRRLNAITTGTILHSVLLAAEGFDVGVFDVYKLKPFPSKFILMLSKYGRAFLTVEEHSIEGGLANSVRQCMDRMSASVHSMALPHKQFFDYGSREWLLEKYGMSQTDIRNQIIELF